MSDNEKKLEDLIKNIKSESNPLTTKSKKLPSKTSFIRLAKEVKTIFDAEERDLTL